MKDNMIFYRIKSIPDLSLAKYRDMGGMNKLIEYNNAFLRQWYRKGIISDVSIHLFYIYLPENRNGEKLEIIFSIKGSRENLSNAIALVKSSSLISNYELTVLDDKGRFGLNELLQMQNATGHDYENETLEKIGFPLEKDMAFGDKENINLDYFLKRQYHKMCIMSKQEIFISNPVDEGKHYYSVGEWKPGEDARLVQFFRTIEAINKSMMYRIDIYPIDRSMSIRNSFYKLVNSLNKRSDKDYRIDGLLRSYEDICKKIEKSPHFNVNICALGDASTVNTDDVELLLDSIGAEGIEEGNYRISSFIPKENNSLNCMALLSKTEELKNKSNNTTILYRNEVGENKGFFFVDESAVGFKGIGDSTYCLEFLPTLYTLEETEAFFQLPMLNDLEVIQRRKESSPISVNNEDSLYIGSDQNGFNVNVNLDILPKHAFIAGVPGSGKTNAMYHLASSLWIKHKIPFLVFEPAKREYRALANMEGMEELRIFAPGANKYFPLHINPFRFAKGLSVSKHIENLCAVFEGSFEMEASMPYLLDQAIEKIYKAYGWSPDMVYTDESNLDFPTLSDLYEQIAKELMHTKYADEVKNNLQSALEVRIGSLLRRETGEIFDSSESTFEPEEWLTIPAVIELEALGDGPANFLTLMLCTLIREVLQVNPKADCKYNPKHKYVRHVIFIEEAHNIIGIDNKSNIKVSENPKVAATKLISKMLAEVRALSEGIIIADQMPSVMDSSVLKNTGLKIGLKIFAEDDRALLCSTMSATETQKNEMGYLNVGEAFVNYEGLKKPFRIHLPKWGEQQAYKNFNWDREPKNDQELYNLLKDREQYQDVWRRTYRIEIKRMARKSDELIVNIKIKMGINEKEINDYNTLIARKTKIAKEALEEVRKMMKQKGIENQGMLFKVNKFYNERKLELQNKKQYWQLIVKDLGEFQILELEKKLEGFGKLIDQLKNQFEEMEKLTKEL